MNPGHLVCMAVLCISLALVACSRPESVSFCRPRTTRVPSSRRRRWPGESHHAGRGARADSAARANTARFAYVESQFFSAVTIGVRVRSDAGKTLVEYFERRFTDPVYLGMVRSCLHLAQSNAP